MPKRILTVLSEFGYWGEELVGPLETLDPQGYAVDFMTARGNRPHALPASMQPGFFDPPLQKVVTSEHYAWLACEVDQSNRLDNPINLSSWFPERPYFNNPSFGHALEAYYSWFRRR